MCFTGACLRSRRGGIRVAFKVFRHGGGGRRFGKGKKEINRSLAAESIEKKSHAERIIYYYQVELVERYVCGPDPSIISKLGFSPAVF